AARLQPLTQQQCPDRNGFCDVHWTRRVLCHRRSCRAISQPASATSKKTRARNNVASALTSGLTPRRTLENTAIGKVVAEGPRITSGTTSGASNANPNTSRPGKRANRAMLKPAKVPSTRERVAATAATSRLVSAAAANASSCNSAPYQRGENPAQTVTRREAL